MAHPPVVNNTDWHPPRASEADTCRKYVVPLLQAAGWDSEPHSIAKQRTITMARGNPCRPLVDPRRSSALRTRPLAGHYASRAAGCRMVLSSEYRRPSPDAMFRVMRPVGAVFACGAEWRDDS